VEKVFLGLSSSQWLDLGISLLIVLAVIIVGRWIVQLVVVRLITRLAKRTDTILDDVLVDVLRLPLYLLALVVSFDIAYQRLDFLPDAWESWEDSLFFLLYLAVGFVFAWRFVHNFFIWYGKEMADRTNTDLDEQLMPFFRRIAMVILWMIGIIAVLGHFDINVSGLVTTLGIGSLAVALAAQESLADTISGFLIMVDRPFRIGDRIEIQDLDTWGDVVDIGLRSSRIRTRDNRMVIVPNSVIGKSLVVNYSYPDTRYRIQIHVGLAYGTDIERARKIMVEAVQGVEGVLPDKAVEALFLEFGDSALIFRVRWWLDSYYDARRMFDKVNTAIYNALNEAEVEIPPPQMAVYHKVEERDRDDLIQIVRG
jgi:small-conductance mechanosensitive channel